MPPPDPFAGMTSEQVIEGLHKLGADLLPKLPPTLPRTIVVLNAYVRTDDLGADCMRSFDAALALAFKVGDEQAASTYIGILRPYHAYHQIWETRAGDFEPCLIPRDMYGRPLPPIPPYTDMHG